jgi:hypothetical protein
MSQVVQDQRKKAEKILVLQKNIFFVTENNKNKLECLPLHSFFSLI